ncbi:MAG: hypothetical protein ACI9LM_002863 [Alteromonadaceae bacterium]|jgi:hypothetical protein
MDVITELLPPINLVKAEAAVKDQKQGKKHKKENKVAPEESDLVAVVPIKAKFSDWSSVDRRAGNDRRQQLNKRGRWLESREKNNRREVDPPISMKI